LIKVERPGLDKKKAIKVERQRERPNGDGVKFSPPKIRYGSRVISMVTMTIDILRSHYERQEKESLAVGDPWVDAA
jgi:hypothetical protein